MPKDRTENIDRYKVRGGQLNEYELEKNEGEFEDSRAVSQPEGSEGLRGADEPNAPRRVAERIQQVEQRAHEIVERRRAKQAGGSASKKGARKGGAKKAGKKRAGKKSTKKSAKKAAGKSAKKSARKSTKKGAKKTAARKGSKSRSAKKRGAKKGSKKGAAKKGSRADR